MAVSGSAVRGTMRDKMKHDRPPARIPEREPRGGVVKPTPPELMIDTGTGLDFETRLDRLPGYLTPVDRFFLRGHAPTPRIDAASWRLSVDGDGVRDPVTYTYRDLWEF